MENKLLGNENAEHDCLLGDCGIYSMACYMNKNIITGRWGEGKTACLLLGNQEIEKNLDKLDINNRKIWFMDGERDLDIPELIEIFKSTQLKEERLKKLEALWKAEIIRRAFLQLSVLIDRYVGIDKNSAHWKFVRRAPTNNDFFVPVWKQIPNVIRSLSQKSEIEKPIKDLQTTIFELFEKSAYDALLSCINDIKGQLIPVVGIEPIDTPKSSFDEKNPSLSQELVTSLMNTFTNYFQPSKTPNIIVYIVIPCHRYYYEKFNYPQKVRQYENCLRWDKKKLFQFINRRLCAEFKRVGSEIACNNCNKAWYTIFNKFLENPHSKIKEDTFDYVLRHTHYRPRQLQRFTRRILEVSADFYNCTPDDILTGMRIKEDKINNKCIIDAVNNKGHGVDEDLLIEISRKYPNIEELVKPIFNMSVPIRSDIFKDKIIPYDTKDGRDNLNILWETGIIGVELSGYYTGDEEFIVRMPSKDFLREIKDQSGKLSRKWFLYEHNYRGKVLNIITRYQQAEKIGIKFIIHPCFFEYLAAKVTTKYPIGI